MSLQTNSNKLQAKSGFTIVELLIVIVVIAILAAITIVAYNGITARANSSSALASAQSIAKKIELFNAEETRYPATLAEFTGSSVSDKSYYTPDTNIANGVAAPTGRGIFLTSAVNTTTAPAKPATVTVQKCGTGTSATAIPTAEGAIVNYWKYDGADSGWKTITVGKTSPISASFFCSAGLAS